jgi:hypothetical protein
VKRRQERQSALTLHVVARVITVSFLFNARAAVRMKLSAEQRRNNSPNQETEETHPTDHNEKQKDKERSAKKPGLKALACFSR